MDRDKVFGEIPKGTWVWCTHCERAYGYGEYRIGSSDEGENFLQMCPYTDCDGDAVFDAKEWSWVKEIHPEYEAIPEKSKFYPLN